MGANESSTSKESAVSVEIGSLYPNDRNIARLWTEVRYCTKGKRQGTLFVRNFQNESVKGEQKKCYDNGIKILKQLRHPSIVSFVDASQTDDSVSVVVERVETLESRLPTLTPIEVISGLKNLFEGLVFLKERAQISHNNFSPSSIFITALGEWKIGGFEFATSTKERPTLSNFYGSARVDGFYPETSFNGDCDFYGFGKMILYCTQKVSLSDQSELNRLKDIADQLTNSGNSKTNANDLSNLFTNDLSAISHFLSSIHSRSSIDKDEFYLTLVAKLRALPAMVVARYLTRLLLSRYVLLEERSHTILYPQFLTPIEEDNSRAILPLELFKAYVIPELLKIFCVRECSVRIRLLEHFPRYVSYFDEEQLNTVLKEVRLGAHDSNPRLVASSLVAMAALVPLMGADVVCGWNFVKNFSDGSPKVAAANGHRLSSTVECMYNARYKPSGSRGGSPISKEKRPQCASINERDEDTEVAPERRRPVDDDDTEEDEEVDSESEHSIGMQPMEPMIAETSGWDDDHANSWSEGWNEEEGGTASAEVQVEAQVSRANVSTVPKTDKSLGSEFGVPVVKIASYEDDLFAELEPQIKSRGSLIDQLIAVKDAQDKPPASGELSGGGNLFAMCDDGNDGGWDEENEEVSLPPKLDVETD